MSLAINHNLMAANSSNALSQHYGKLAVSTQRLSTGLRINSASDDAAGLAIRELQRAEISALHQGARNANDAISMIQVADGALGVIDEKLIRMKELAEQAATGTYDSTQRLMIASEFQEMASEINRIANATEFNGVKLLNKDNSNKIRIGEPTVENGVWVGGADGANFDKNSIIEEVEIVNSKAITKSVENLTFTNRYKVNLVYGDENILNWRFDGYGFNNNQKVVLSYSNDKQSWYFKNMDEYSYLFNDIEWRDNSSIHFEVVGYSDDTRLIETGHIAIGGYNFNNRPTILNSDTEVELFFSYNWEINSGSDEYPKASILNIDEYKNGGKVFNDIYIDLDGDGKEDIIKHLQWNDNGRDSSFWKFSFNIDSKFTTKIHFGPGNDSSEDYYYINTRDCTLNGLGLKDVTIETQDKAQRALNRIDDAIETKDNARAYFGAIQNRLENTITNLTTQAENLQASESRISDVDVAIEMTEFVRQQILAQSAVAMLSQANSLPQMAMQLLGG